MNTQLLPSQFVPKLSEPPWLFKSLNEWNFSSLYIPQLGCVYIHVYKCNNETHDSFCPQSLSYSKGEDAVPHITNSNFLEKLRKRRTTLHHVCIFLWCFGFFLYTTHSLWHYVKQKPDSMILSVQESCISAYF